MFEVCNACAHEMQQEEKNESSSLPMEDLRGCKYIVAYLFLMSTFLLRKNRNANKGWGGERHTFKIGQ